jgi:precorrin-2 dehydrogenase/sirohydrochlorin ferrochelatase
VTVPLFVRLDGARVVCIGAGRVAAGKALPLLDEGADLLVIAPEAVDEIAVEPRLTWLRRPWDPDDLAGALLVIAATSSPAVNAAVAAEAAGRSRRCRRRWSAGPGRGPAGEA